MTKSKSKLLESKLLKIKDEKHSPKKNQSSLFRPSLDSLNCESTEMDIALVAATIKPLLLAARTRSAFVKNVSEIIQKGYDSNEQLQPVIADLLFQLRKETVQLDSGDLKDTTFSFVTVLRMVAGQYLPKKREACSPLFRQRLKFLNELLKRKLISQSVFLNYASALLQHGMKLFPPFIYEILRNVDMLTERKALTLSLNELRLWQCFTCLLAGTLRQSESLGPEQMEMVQFVNLRGLRYGHTHTESCEYQPDLPTAPTLSSLTDSQPTIETTSSVTALTINSADVLKASIEKAPDEFNSFITKIVGELKTACKESAVIFVSELLDQICLTKPPLSHNLSNLFDALSKAFSKSSGSKKGFRSTELAKYWAENVCFKKLSSKNKTVEKVDRFCNTRFWFIHELCKRNFFCYGYFGNIVDRIGLKKASRPLCQFYFLYKAVRYMDEHVELDGWPSKILWLQTRCNTLFKKCKTFSATNLCWLPEVLDYLHSMEQKGIWCDPAKIQHQPQQPQNEPQLSLGTAICPSLPPFNIASIIESIDLQQSGEMETVIENLKQCLKGQSPAVFTENMEAIMEKIFDVIEGNKTTKVAAALCIGIGRVANSVNKRFMAEAQEYWLKVFSFAYRSEIETELDRLQREIEETDMPQEQMILLERLEHVKQSSLKVSSKCPRLVGRLYLLKCLPFSFIISFMDALLLTGNEEVFQGMLEMLTDAGKEIESHAQAIEGMSDKMANYFELLTQIGHQTNASAIMKTTVDEILALKKNDWPVLTSEQRSARKLNLLLSAINPETAKHPQQLFAAGNKVHAFLSGCPEKMCRPFYQVFIAKLQHDALGVAHQQQSTSLPTLTPPPEAVPVNNEEIMPSFPCRCKAEPQNVGPTQLDVEYLGSQIATGRTRKRKSDIVAVFEPSPKLEKN